MAAASAAIDLILSSRFTSTAEVVAALEYVVRKSQPNNNEGHDPTNLREQPRPVQALLVRGLSPWCTSPPTAPPSDQASRGEGQDKWRQ